MKTKFKEGQAVLYQNGTTFGNEMPPVKEYTLHKSQQNYQDGLLINIQKKMI